MRLDEEIQHYAESLLTTHYTDLDVKIGSARLTAGEGLTIYNLVFSEKQSRPNESSQMIRVDEIFIACDATLEQIVKGNLVVDKITIKRPILNLVHQKSKQWNVMKLFPLPRFGNGTSSPNIIIENAQITCSDLCKVNPRPLMFRDISLRLESRLLSHDELIKYGVVPQLQSADPLRPSTNRIQQASYQKNSLKSVQKNNPLLKTKLYEIKGSLGSEIVKKIGFHGDFIPSLQRLNLQGEVTELKLSPELLASLPMVSKKQLRGIQVGGNLTVSFQVSQQPTNDPSRLSEIDFSANYSLKQGWLQHPLLPERAKNITLSGRCSSQELRVTNLTGEYGQANFTAALTRTGWDSNAPLSINGVLQHFRFENLPHAILPPSTIKILERYHPTGAATAHVKASYDGNRWWPDMTLHFEEVAFEDHEKFAYRLDQATGTVHYTIPYGSATYSLNANLKAYAAREPIAIRAELTGLVPPKSLQTRAQQLRSTPTPLPWFGFIDFRGKNIVTDQRLIDAVKNVKAREFLNDLHAEGTLFNFHWRGESTLPRNQTRESLTHMSEPRITVEMDIIQGRFQYKKFPYPLQNVTGHITALGKKWTFHDLICRNADSLSDSSKFIQCNGRFEPHPLGSELYLALTAIDIPLDLTLKQATSPEIRKSWDQIRPTGKIDATLTIHHITGQPKPTILVRLRPHKKSLSIEPLFFPYTLRQISGDLEVRNGIVSLNGFQASHGRIMIGIEQLTWQPLGTDGWHVKIAGLTADQLYGYRDRDLTTALPRGIRNAIDLIRPEGNFNLHNGNFTFTQKSISDPQIDTTWDLQCSCHRATLHCGVMLKDIYGVIHLQGKSDRNKTYSLGKLNLDSVFWNNYHLTELKGPLFIDRTACFLGKGVGQLTKQPLRPLTAKLLGGDFQANIQANFDGPTRFKIEAAVGKASLATFAVEHLKETDQELFGTLSGNLSLTGTALSYSRTTQSLKGHGALKITDTNIYEMPQLVAMLKVLRNRVPDTVAFNECNANFKIKGEHIEFEQLNLLGDVVSLYGKGEANFNQDIDFIFHSQIGRNDAMLPMVRKFFGQASQNILQIKVDGTATKPNVQRIALPLLQQTIDRLNTTAPTTRK